MKDRREKSVAKWALRACNKIITFVTERERERDREREDRERESDRDTETQRERAQREHRESTEKRKFFYLRR